MKTTLDNAVDARETVTVSYTKPTSSQASGIRDAAGNEAEAFSDYAVTNSTEPNSRPTGRPRITGQPIVNATPSASSSEIEDADGLTGATFAWQWIASDGISDADIPGATTPSYTPVAADVGKRGRARPSVPTAVAISAYSAMRKKRGRPEIVPPPPGNPSRPCSVGLLVRKRGLAFTDRLHVFRETPATGKPAPGGTGQPICANRMRPGRPGVAPHLEQDRKE